MADNSESGGEEQPGAKPESSWGAKLFFATLILTLIFFWWLLIYSGGASPTHG